MRIALVHNATAGTSGVGRQKLIELLQSSGHRVEHCSSKEDWRAMLGRSPELIAVAGGDGTIRKVAKAVVDRPVPIAVLPLGTANNIARALGVADLPLPELVASWDPGRFTSVDVGVARGPWGTDLLLESAGAGVLAATIGEIDHGGSEYVNDLEAPEARIAAATDVFERLARTTPPCRARVRMDDHELVGEFVLLEVMNLGAAGPDLRLSPRADPCDGVFDVVMIESRQREKLTAFLSAVRAGTIGDLQTVVHHARRFGVECEGCDVHLDDGVWFGAREFDVTVRPSALKFLLPGAAVQGVGVDASDA